MSTTMIPGKPVLGVAEFDFAAHDYTNEEHFFRGTARSYADDADAAFHTRILVRRPVDATRFNGTVFVEWLNVSGGLDIGSDWDYTHRHLMRSGAAWVGVSAQRAGIEGGGLIESLHLKLANPERYRSLDHPGDAFCFDIFSQAGHSLLGAGSPLREIVPERLLAIGQSQSAAFLTTYVNAVDHDAQVFDGFLIHGRGGAGAKLDGRRPAGMMKLEDLAAHQGEQAVREDGDQIRDDVRVPVLTVQAEYDVSGLGSMTARQPDSDRFRLWEVAGTGHADTYLLVAHSFDDGNLPIDQFARLLAPTDAPMGLSTASLINSGPQMHYVLHAAIEHLDRWVRRRSTPPCAPLLTTKSNERDPFARDELGNVVGGVRSPWMDVPTSTLSGLGQEGHMFAFLFGTTTPFDDDLLIRLYPGGRADYLERFRSSLDVAISARFILESDRHEIEALAAASLPPVLRA